MKGAKPCPFCGATDLVYVDVSSEDAEGVLVRCRTCRAEGPHINQAKDKAALVAWNGRDR